MRNYQLCELIKVFKSTAPFDSLYSESSFREEGNPEEFKVINEDKNEESDSAKNSGNKSEDSQKDKLSSLKEDGNDATMKSISGSDEEETKELL